MITPRPDDSVRKKIAKLIGHTDFPLTIEFDGSKVVGIKYESSWRTGSTESVEDKDGNVIDYKENYEDHKLTQAQIKSLDELIQSII